tara:strand:- start:22382 stop:23320 length:939 start_codon:yes stop_codon:yes gene_type:complete
MILVSCASRGAKTIIAHRGASGYLPEHTLEAAAMAYSFGVDFIEPDLVVTKDNHLVVLHDVHIDSTTNVASLFPEKKRKDGRFYAVDFTLFELKQLRVNERTNLKTQQSVFSKRFPQDKSSFRIPSFQEFIELIQGLNQSMGKDIGIYPEMKSPEFHAKEGKDIAKLTFKILEKYGYNSEKANIYVQCFYPPTLKRLKNEFKAKFPLIQLIAEQSWNESSANYQQMQTKAGIKEIASYADGIGPYVQQLIKNEEMVKWAHAYGLKVHAYTHRSDALPEGMKTDKEFFQYFFGKLNIDGIFSDFSDRALPYAN